jgi:uncharacterized protein (TIGR03083 family)
MEIAEHIAVLRREGLLLADAAAMHTLDTPVPTTPEWTLGDLIRHIGEVHRWAAVHVARGLTSQLPAEEEPDLTRNWPDDDDALLEWYLDGHEALVNTLDRADPALQCWSFLPAPSPLAFWARRQAHETAIHRVDSESAGGPITEVEPEFAADGVDELLRGFFGRRRRFRTEVTSSMMLQAADAGRVWWVQTSPDGVVTRDEAAPADCVVRAPANDLYLLLWNRREPSGLDVTGDPAILTGWRDGAIVTWS